LANALLLCAACGSGSSAPEQAPPNRVTAESSYDASEPVVDAAYRFRLSLPGTGWKLMHAADARGMVVDAIAGAVKPDGVAGVVIVDRLPGVALADASALLDARLPNVVSERSGPARVGDYDAVRDVYRVEVEGTQFRYLRVIFLRDGSLYQLLAWGQAETTSTEDLEPFFQAFTPTPGALEIPTQLDPTEINADGGAWRVVQGEYDSAVSGLHLPPVAGWEYVLGAAMTRANPEAELTLSNASAGAHITVVSVRVAGDSDEGGVARARAIATEHSGRQGVALGTVTRTVGGQEVVFTRYANGKGLEVEVGIRAKGDVASELWLAYPVALRESATAACSAVLEAMSFVSRPERDALERALASRRAVGWAVGPTSRFNGAEFRDYEHNLTWSAPPGLHDVGIGPAAAVSGANVVLSLRAPLLSVFGRLEVVAGAAGQTKAVADAAVAHMLDTRAVPWSVEGRPAHRSRSTWMVGDAAFQYSLVAVAHGEDLVVMTVWGPMQDEAVAARIDAVLRGVRLPAALEPVTRATGRLIDDHFGVSVIEPLGWSRVEADGMPNPSSRVAWWERDQTRLGLMRQAGAPHHADEAWVAAYLDQNTRDALATHGAVGTPTALRDSLDGQPSRRLVYDNAEVEIVVRKGVAYTVMRMGTDEAAGARFREGVRWVP